MKNLGYLKINILLISSLVLLGVFLISAQQPDKSVARLKFEHNRLLAITNDPNTSPEVREINKQLVVKNEASLYEAILKSIAELEAYARQNADLLDADDRRDLNEKIEAYRYDLSQVNRAGKLRPPEQLLDNTTAATNVATNSRLLKPIALIDDRSMPTTNLFRNSSNTATHGYFTTDTLPAPPLNFPGDRNPASPTITYTRPSASVFNQYTLTVNVIGNNGGKGTIHDDQPAGIVCDTGCTKDYQDGTSVTLNFQPSAGSTFVSWGGACTASPCTVVMSAARTVTATFAGPPPTPVVAAVAGPSATPEIYDWGRVRGYFTSGIVLSKDRDITSTERNNFSKPDIYLDFTLDTNWLPNKLRPGKKYLGIFDNANTFFSARMTSMAVTNTTPATAAATTTPTPGPSPSPAAAATPCNSAECSTFLTSEKAAKLEVGAYFPIEIGHFNVTEKGKGADADRAYEHAVFIAPLLKGGIQTITGDRTSATAEARRFGGDDIYNFYSFGGMFGHYKKSGDPNVAPELINWLTITSGRFENFEYLDTNGPKDNSGNYLIRRRPWRYEATGMLKIPKTDFVVGFNGNFGKGPDDLRFLFGMKFNIAQIIGKLQSKP